MASLTRCSLKKNENGLAAMMLREPRTIAEAIERCRLRLRNTSASPGLDARLLAQFVTGLDASALIAYGDAALEQARRRKLFELTERRASGEPIAYIVGKKSFCGLDLHVDKRVLVPRPETEELVQACVDDWSGRDADIADIGTGSGAIACALAHFLPAARITATDVSAPALEVARNNAATLLLSEQISFLESDLFDALDGALRFDAIVTNLPYVGNEQQGLEPNVSAHEPSQALLAGPDGLDLYRRLFNEAPQRMKAGGVLYCECGPDNAHALQALAVKAFPGAAVELRKDLAGRDRLIVCRLAGVSA